MNVVILVRVFLRPNISLECLWFAYYVELGLDIHGGVISAQYPQICCLKKPCLLIELGLNNLGRQGCY